MGEGEGSEFLDGLAVGIVLLNAEGEVRLRTAPVDRLVASTALADPARLMRRVSSLAERCQASGGRETESFEPVHGDHADGVRLSAAPVAAGGTVVTVEALRPSEAVEERVRQFVSQLTHDLRTPLTSILGASDLLLSGRVGTPEERHLRLLKIVNEGTQRMAALLTELAHKFVEPEVRT